MEAPSWGDSMGCIVERKYQKVLPSFPVTKALEGINLT